MAAINNRYKKALLDKINRLSNIEHEEIFKLMRQKNEPFTQNKNGVFFNLSLISDEIISEIEKFVEFCLKNKQELDEYDKKLNECKISNNYTLLQRQDTQSELLPFQLDAVLAPKNEIKMEQENDWLAVISENKYTEKLTQFMENLNESVDKLNKKKNSGKFINAKKRYARRVVNDKKIELDLISDLASEAYLITA